MHVLHMTPVPRRGGAGRGLGTARKQLGEGGAHGHPPCSPQSPEGPSDPFQASPRIICQVVSLPQIAHEAGQESRAPGRGAAALHHHGTVQRTLGTAKSRLFSFKVIYIFLS